MFKQLRTFKWRLYITNVRRWGGGAEGAIIKGIGTVLEEEEETEWGKTRGRGVGRKDEHTECQREDW